MLVPAARPVLTQTCAGCERNPDAHAGVNLSFLGAVRAEQRARVGIGVDVARQPEAMRRASSRVLQHGLDVVGNHAAV
jgi:hypothetical protein